MYLGIDQSLRSSGLAVVSEKQEIVCLGEVAPGKLTGVTRLAHIRSALRDHLAAEPDIKFAAMEGYAYDVGAGRVFELGEVGAVVKLTLHDAGIPFVIVPPASLKLFVSGMGGATKEQMREATYKKWGLDIDQDDQCDAHGLAQLARAFHLGCGSTRAELEVIKKLKDTTKKISLVAAPAKTISI